MSIKKAKLFLVACFLFLVCFSFLPNTGCKAGGESVCTPNSKKCDGSKALVCKADGSGFDSTNCASDQTCESGECKKKAEPACKAGEKKCESNKALVCKADGSGFDSINCASDQTCESGECKKKVEPVCKAGEKKCESNKALVCKADGSGFDSTNCASDETCENGECKKKVEPVCKAGEKKCESNKALVCKADGSGFDSTSCASDETCQEGECKKTTPNCPPPNTDCSGACVDLKKDDKHCGSCGQPCQQKEACVEGKCLLKAGAEQIIPLKGIQFSLRYIPAGTFTMGSPATEPRREAHETQHEVTLTRAFWMQETEVTQKQFLAFMGYNLSNNKSCVDTCPVDSVSWHEAAAYANAVSQAAGLSGCYDCTGSQATVTCVVKPAYVGVGYYACLGYRLPTESEWEYAYRAGTTTAFYNGDYTRTNEDCLPSDPKADEIAWYRCNSGNSTKPVGGKDANAWGLRDMTGNMHEWCYDWYSASYPVPSVTNPIGAEVGSLRVIRSGAYGGAAFAMRAAYRTYSPPTDRYGSFGMRVVRTAR
ncbi:SUMF1/EgtB/PvdO family nonheme iron enzyme [Myxococcota bacterium]|nr:SUMF1/EgtB/PvdO family nonheme iron enzyme [Myxococcota bacterium]